jgi:ribonuclease HI
MSSVDSRRIVLYVDGSGSDKLTKSGKTLPIGWGVVALHDDCHHEIVKGELPGRGTDGSLFELYAFIEGVQYAIGKGFAPEQISIYSDDDRIYRAVFMFHRENYVATETVDKLKARIEYACRRFGADAFENVLACLQRSSVSKLVNSNFSLYHNRAHYLANAGRIGADVLEGAPPKAFLSYDDWLSNVVFKFYMSPEVATERGIFGPFQPERATLNGAVMWDFVPPFIREPA